MEKNNTYIKTDNNFTINEQSIIWIKKMNECLYVCTKKGGCNIIDNIDTHKICKMYSLNSYNKLNKHFE